MEGFLVLLFAVSIATGPTLAVKQGGPDCSKYPNNGACTREYNPVCGSNGRTYGNPCQFCYVQTTNSELTFGHYGRCESTVAGPDCSKCSNDGDCNIEFKLVCGSNGETYSHCEFCYEKTKNANLTFEHYGICGATTLECRSTDGMEEDMMICPMMYAPVCASNGQTYGNYCTFCWAASQDSTLKFKYDGEC